MKGLIYQEDITLNKICAPSNRVLKYIKQKLKALQGKINSSTIIIGVFKPTSNDESNNMEVKKQKNAIKKKLS